MKERPILFSGAMVKAILADNKTQTRRVMKPSLPAYVTRVGYSLMTEKWHAFDDNQWETITKLDCPYGQPADRLWVRETWALGADEAGEPKVFFRATDTPMVGMAFPNKPAIEAWKPSIHMPRWASRLTLEICDVRVQRVQEISEEDAIAEGIERTSLGFRDYELPANVMHGVPASYSFQTLWDSINAARGFSWQSNPFVWALTFRRVQP